MPQPIAADDWKDFPSKPLDNAGWLISGIALASLSLVVSLTAVYCYACRQRKISRIKIKGTDVSEPKWRVLLSTNCLNLSTASCLVVPISHGWCVGRGSLVERRESAYARLCNVLGCAAGRCLARRDAVWCRQEEDGWR